MGALLRGFWRGENFFEFWGPQVPKKEPDPQCSPHPELARGEFCTCAEFQDGNNSEIRKITSTLWGPLAPKRCPPAQKCPVLKLFASVSRIILWWFGGEKSRNRNFFSEIWQFSTGPHLGALEPPAPIWRREVRPADPHNVCKRRLDICHRGPVIAKFRITPISQHYVPKTTTTGVGMIRLSTPLHSA